MKSSVKDLFAELQEIDPSLVVKPNMLNKLSRRQVVSKPYNREALFTAMSNGRVCLFSDYPISLRGNKFSDPVKAIASVLNRMSRVRKFEVRCGPSGTAKYLTGKELMRRWNGDRARVSVTDLHIRDTRLENLLNPDNLSWFNVLPKCSEDVERQEMMSLVICSKGSFTDSHSDAPDSSNHCFQGKKVWLMWDTFEGEKYRMQDCSRHDVTDFCSFDMDRFLKLRSAKWLVVSDGDTLFVPGDYTHKVITLERYIGFGGFYVSLPNSLRSLSRWMSSGALWSSDLSNCQDDQLVVDISKYVNKRVGGLANKSGGSQQRLGYDFLPMALDSWRKTTPNSQQRSLKSSDHFSSYLKQLSLIEKTK